MTKAGNIAVDEFGVRTVDLVIADPNCSSVMGHYFEYDASVVRAAKAAGVRVVVLARHDIDPELTHRAEAVPTFRQDIWKGAGEGGAWARLSANLVFLLDLIRGLRRLRLAPDATIFVHTFIHTQIFALVLLPLYLVFRPRIRFVYLLRFQPDFYRCMLARVSLRLLEHLAVWRRIRLTSDSTLLARELEELTTLPVDVQPIPHIPPPNFAVRKPPGASCHFVSLGNARDEKGIFEILGAIRVLANNAEMKDYRFTLQCNDAQSDVAAVIAAFAADLPPNCVLLFDKLDTAQYYGLLWDADVVLLPYWRGIYSSRTSGVFMEALSAGKPVIATRGTWMEDELSRHGAGLVCADHDPASLYAAIRAAAAQKDTLTRRAEAGRAAWLAVHNAEALVADLLTPAIRPACPPVKQVTVFYPFADLMERRSGSSRRCSLLLDYLGSMCGQVHAIQAGTRRPWSRDNITLEALGHASRLSRWFHGAIHLAMRLLPPAWRRHEWLIREYHRLTLDAPMRRRLRRAIARADIVVLEYPFWASAVVPIARRLNRKVILTSHDILAEQITEAPLLRRFALGMEERAARRVDHVVAVSTGDQAFLRSHGIAAGLAPNPTDARLFGLDVLADPRAVVTSLYDVALPAEEIVLFVGSRYEPNMIAVDRLREMAAALARDPRGRRIGIVTAGGCADPMHEDNFLALGMVDDALLLALYGLARAVVIPLPFVTGTPMKTVEAMASGLVVLGTSNAFRSLAVTDGEHVVIEDDVEQFPARLMALLNDEPGMRRIAAAGRAFAKSYDYRNCYTLYSDLIGLGKPSAEPPMETSLKPIQVNLARLAICRNLPDLAEYLLASLNDPAVMNTILAETAAGASSALAGNDDIPTKPDHGTLWQSFHTRHYDKVITRAGTLLETWPRDAELHFLLAQSLHNTLADLHRARAHYAMAAREGFNSYWISMGVARLNNDVGRHWHAAWHILECIARPPWRTGIDSLLKSLFLSVTRGMRVLVQSTILEKLEFFVPGNTGLLRSSAPGIKEVSIAPSRELWTLFHAGEFAQVVLSAMDVSPHAGLTGEFHFLLAQSLHNGGDDLQAALRHYEAALNRGFNWHWILAGRARLHRDLGHPWLAARDFLLAALVRPMSRQNASLIRQAVGMLIRAIFPGFRNTPIHFT